eukprot:4687431-Heterocapsa_arctica.AAC.1
MIKAAAKGDAESSQGSQPDANRRPAPWTTPKRSGWAAAGYEHFLDEGSDKDGENGPERWRPTWGYDKNKRRGGKKY